MVAAIPLRMREWTFSISKIMAKRAKKRNFSETEIEVLVGEVEEKQHDVADFFGLVLQFTPCSGQAQPSAF